MYFFKFISKVLTVLYIYLCIFISLYLKFFPLFVIKVFFLSIFISFLYIEEEHLTSIIESSSVCPDPFATPKTFHLPTVSLETTSKQHNNTLSLSCNYWYLGNSSECRLKERGVAGGFRKLQHIEYCISWFQIISDFWYCPAIETSNCEIILF